MTTPTHIIILPYRDRYTELLEFNRVMPEYFNKDICERQGGQWEIWYIEQSDNKLFNRGGTKNIGALEALRRFFPEQLLKTTTAEYQLNYEILNQITLIFHDVDVCVKEPGLIQYECQLGEVRHPYGEIDPRKGPILGCFCILRLGDFLKVGGFPNYYGWGLEDVALGHRCLAHQIQINEDNLIPRYSHPGIHDPISHTTPEKLAFIRACHSRNLAVFRRENQSMPLDTPARIKYRIISEIQPDINHPNIKVLKTEFEII
jgi:hypothetical protein